MESDANANSAAVLMVLLGGDLASEVMSHLEQNEVHQLTAAMDQVSGLAPECVDRLDKLLDLHEFPKAQPPSY